MAAFQSFGYIPVRIDLEKMEVREGMGEIGETVRLITGRFANV